MDFKAFIEAVKIETKPVEVRGKTLYVRKLSTVELNDCLQLAEKWQGEREKKLGVKESETVIVKVPVKDKPDTFIDMPFKTTTLAMQMMAKAVTCLCENDKGEPFCKDVSQVKELAIGHGKLQESEVRAIISVHDSFDEPEKKDEGDEKN